MYLTYEHYSNRIPPCAVGAFFDCGLVLKSQYAMVFGVPLALIGVVHYLIFFNIACWAFVSIKRLPIYSLIVQSVVGFIASLYFVYLQIFVIHAICLYCMVSALVSTTIFIFIMTFFGSARKRLFGIVFGIFYRNILKPILFKFDPEKVHVMMVSLGEVFGGLGVTKLITRFFVKEKQLELAQNILGIKFENCIGLAAGFDYEARLTQALSAWDFGFQSVGTITDKAYGGNEKPMLGRLPKSKSLMVNKGYKNLGAEATISKLENLKFEIPVGVSIGRTNSKKMVSQEASVVDIVSCFKKFENSKVQNSYYELNISCPNLHGPVSFYPSKNLEELLFAVDGLDIKKPIFVKMPIEKNDDEFLGLLKIISEHKIAGVIIGNLQKDHSHPSLDVEEASKFDVGGFSGKPTFERSNQLINLCYKNYKDRFVIIGCGGVFNAEDAYEKIQRGAALVQMITGMIFEGPEIISVINFGLVDLMKRDGYSNISEVIGTKKGV